MFNRFFKEETGQTTVEYLLIIAVIVVVISLLGSQMQKRMTGVIDEVFKGVNDRIHSLMKSAGADHHH